MEEIKMNVRCKQLDGSTEVSKVTLSDDNEVESENSVEPGQNPGGGDFPPVDDYDPGNYNVNIFDDWNELLPFKPNTNYKSDFININSNLNREEVIEILNNTFPDAQSGDYFYLLDTVDGQFSVVCRRFDGEDWAFGFYDGDVMTSAIDTRIEGGSTGGEWIDSDIIYQYLDENSPYISADEDEDIFKKLQNLINTCGKGVDLIPATSELYLHRISFDCSSRHTQDYPYPLKMYIDIYTVFEDNLDLDWIWDNKNELISKVATMLLDINEDDELVPVVIRDITTEYGTTDKVIYIQYHGFNFRSADIYFDDISNFEDEVYSMD